MKPTRIRYGSLHAQVAELWHPEDTVTACPVVILIHGGFWRQPYTKRLMHGLARAVLDRGWVAYNIEYRRVGPLGKGGWPETFEDVSDAIDALAGVDRIDHRRIVTCGHSAGGQLALWAGGPRSTGVTRRPESESIRLRAVISLAGVVDLESAAQFDLGRGAVQALMGGGPEERPDRYALASPASLLPIGIPQLLVHGLADHTVPASLSAAYVELAQSRGDDAEYVPLSGVSHMEMIDPGGAAFEVVLSRLDLLFSLPSG
jgi:acetyl esterase/lipase